MAERSLQGASILVAGGGGALGSRIAERLAARGARITIAGRDMSRLEAVRSSIVGDVAVVPLDLMDPSGPAGAVAATVSLRGGIDGIVNAAGVVAFGPLAEITDSTLEQLVGVNFVGPARLIRAALPYLDGGFILNVSAIVADMPTAGMAPYSATKAAMTALDAALGRELRRSRITVIDARPPHTETGLAARPIAGAPPVLPRGLEPDAVADRIVRAIEIGERDLPAEAFSG